MELLGDRPSWRISVDRWNTLYDTALWFRAAERIAAPAGGIVPGPLDIDPLPEATTTTDPELVDDWLNWWRTLVEQPRWPTGRYADLAAERAVMAGPPPPHVRFAPPDFPGLADWPALRSLVKHRWPEATQWHNARKIAGVSKLHHGHDVGVTRVVAEVERRLGRRVPPFEIEFIVVPVRDTEIRPLTASRYLVPEPVYGRPDWERWLSALVLRLAG